jgi:putative PIN family toxin of toxin-antitoxin system
VLRAVLDANVYVSAYVRPEGPPGQIIGRLLRDSAFQVVLSQPIIDEVLHALAYPKVQKAARTKLEADLWFEDIAVLAQLVTGDLDTPRLSEDPDDDKYVSAAIEGRATFVVTGDPDLLRLKEHEGLRIVSPRAFLDLIRL